jgi:hypothetical protein
MRSDCDAPGLSANVGGNAVFYSQPAAPVIPVDKARECPQCGEAAWRETRWCWHCGFDFARIFGMEPVKLLYVSVLFNVASLTAAGVFFFWWLTR